MMSDDGTGAGPPRGGEGSDRALLIGLARYLAGVSLAVALAAWIWRPDRPVIAGGVLGGAVLAGYATWAIAGMSAALTARDEGGRMRRVSRLFPLVKFFTRHAILAVVAYVLLVRLRLDPVGMLVGVTSVVVAAALAAARRH